MLPNVKRIKNVMVLVIMVFDYDKKLILSDKNSIINEIEKLKRRKNTCGIYYNEYPIKKENILKFALLMFRSKFVDNFFTSDYATVVLNTLINKDNLDNYTAIAHIFNIDEMQNVLKIAKNAKNNPQLQT